MIALFPGSCIGGHKPGNEANHMIDFKKSHQHICGGGGGGEGEVFHITHSLTSHTLQRSGHTATIELSPRQKLDVTNQIRALRADHICCHGVQYVTCLMDVSILLPISSDQ